MKYLILLILLLSASCFAVIETASTEGRAKELYYKMGTGFTGEADNTEWHLSFKSGTLGGTIRINRNVNLYEALTLADTDFGTVVTEDDLADESKFQLLENDNKEWKMGAFNIGGNPETESGDYGWGNYMFGSGVVIGSKLFVIEIIEETVSTYKQIVIDRLEGGTYFLRLANLDGTNQTEPEVSKSSFVGKAFGYYNIIEDRVIDAQPGIADWDFVIKSYREMLETQDGFIPYTVVGVLSSEWLWVAEQSNELSTMPEQEAYSFEINTIGHDWKSFAGSWVLNPVSYFAQRYTLESQTPVGVGPIFKIDFLSYVGGQDQTAEFEINAITNSVELNNSSLAIHPNVTSANSQVSFIHSLEGLVNLQIVDSFGNLVVTNNFMGNGSLIEQALDIPNLSSGIYFVQVQNLNNVSSLKLIVN